MSGATSADSGHRATVVALLVDRDADTRRMYAEFLSQSSAYAIDEADDGREALAKALGIPHDVIVTETRLPGISGLDLCALLRREPSTKQTSIVVVTGDAFVDDIQRAERAGADVVLVKPCLPETLHGEIQRLVTQPADMRERRRALREQLARTDAIVPSRRAVLSSGYNRRDTTAPPAHPPTLHCPACDQVLRYVHSHVGGVNARNVEQWDYYECTRGCGTFQYRERTRKIRRV